MLGTGKEGQPDKSGDYGPRLLPDYYHASKTPFLQMFFLPGFLS